MPKYDVEVCRQSNSFKKYRDIEADSYNSASFIAIQQASDDDWTNVSAKSADYFATDTEWYV